MDIPNIDRPRGPDSAQTKKLLKQLSREEMGAGGEFMAAVWKFVSIFPEKALMKCHEISLILMNLHRQ